MRIMKALLQILLVGILLAILQPHCEVNAIRSGDFKPMHCNSKMISGSVSTTQVKENKIAKRPSAPNPVGNHRPPSTR